ncbi:MAG: carboxymuconolactone decarboxylase family protein [Acidimicrobiia bacterium]
MEEHERRIPVGVAAAEPLRAALADWQSAVVRLDGVDPLTTELVRLRAAQHHDCRVCQSLRWVEARDAGFDESMTDKVRAYEASDLPDRHKAALRLADALMTQPGRLPGGLVDELRVHFTDAELVELTLDVMKWNYQKVHVALRTDVPPEPGQLTDLAFDGDGRPRILTGARTAD